MLALDSAFLAWMLALSQVKTEAIDLYLLSSADHRVRLAVIERTGRMGSAAKSLTPALIRHLRNEPVDDLRVEVLRVLHVIAPNDPRVFDVTIGAFADESLKVHFAAVGCASKAGAPIVLALANTLSSERPALRRGASLALSCFKGDAADAIPALRKALADTERIVRINAACTLIHLGPKAEPAIPELILALRDPEASSNAAHALGAIGKASVPFLRKTIMDKDAVVRLRSAIALFETGPDARDAIPELRAALQDSDAHLRYYASKALETLNSSK